MDFSTSVATSDDCCELCKATRYCRFWTFSTPERGIQPNYCWLKNKRVKPFRRTGAKGLVSGYVKKNKGSSDAAADRPQKEAARKAKKASKTKGVEEAKPKIKGPSKKNIEQSQALVKEAQQFYHQGRGGDAEPLLRKAIAKDASNALARMWMGFVLEQLNRWQVPLSLSCARAPSNCLVGSLLRSRSLSHFFFSH